MEGNLVVIIIYDFFCSTTGSWRNPLVAFFFSVFCYFQTYLNSPRFESHFIRDLSGSLWKPFKNKNRAWAQSFRWTDFWAFKMSKFHPIWDPPLVSWKEGKARQGSKFLLLHHLSKERLKPASAMQVSLSTSSALLNSLTVLSLAFTVDDYPWWLNRKSSGSWLVISWLLSGSRVLVQGSGSNGTTWDRRPINKNLWNKVPFQLQPLSMHAYYTFTASWLTPIQWVKLRRNSFISLNSKFQHEIGSKYDTIKQGLTRICGDWG